jgi:hypothetical protein
MAIEVVSQQEQAAMAATAATTLVAAAPPANLVTALQMRVTTAEAQQARAAVAALELQHADVLGVTAPLPPRPATTTAPVPAAAPRQADLTANAFEPSSIGYLHAQAASIQDIRSLVPIVFGVMSTKYPHWRDLVPLML